MKKFPVSDFINKVGATGVEVTLPVARNPRQEAVHTFITPTQHPARTKVALAKLIAEHLDRISLNQPVHAVEISQPTELQIQVCVREHDGSPPRYFIVSVREMV